jgi:hypothetical protein
MRAHKDIAAYGDLKVEYIQQKGEINIVNGKATLYSLKLSELVKDLKSKYPDNSGVDQKDMIFDRENEFAKLKFIFFNIYGSDNQEDENSRIDNADFYVLIDLK